MARRQSSAKRRRLTSDLERPVEMEGVTEGPHSVFSNDLVLDLILSSLDGKSQLTARLVCKKWNDRILAQFHKKLALRLKGEDQPAAGRKRLRDVDPKILSSLSVHDDQDDLEELNRAFRTAANFLFTRGNEGRLRSLFVRWMDKKALGCFIKAANKGFLCNLEELVCDNKCCLKEVKKSARILLPNALPKLKFLCLEPMNDSCEPKNVEKGLVTMKVFEASGYLETFRSFLTAAPNLIHLKTNLAFDLSGLKDLKILNISANHAMFNPNEGKVTLKSVNRGLRSLNLHGGRHFNLCELPTFPNLTSLAIIGCSPESQQRVDWTIFPKLKKLKLKGFYRELLRVDNLLPLPDHLMKFCLTGFLANRKCAGTISAVLNLSVPRVVLKLSSRDENNVSVFFDILRKADFGMKEPAVEEQGPRVLELRLGKRVELDADKPIKDFAAIMEKLSRNWDVVRFQGFDKSPGQPRWTEVKLAGDKKDFECLHFLHASN